MEDDMGSIDQRDAAKLTLDQVRLLVRWCNDQLEGLWDPAGRPRLTVTQILAHYHAAVDNDYYSFEDFLADKPDEAMKIRNNILSLEI